MNDKELIEQVRLELFTFADNMVSDRQCAKQIIALCNESKWVSMDSAPKDGTLILAWRFYPVTVRWTKDKHYPWEAVPLGAKLAPFLANGFHADDPALKGWQPLPKPPEAGK